MTVSPIHWGHIAAAVEAYQQVGYRYVELPWIINREAAEATCPPSRRQFQTWAGCLPASGEQCFLHRLQENSLAPGRYVTATPCFRDEPLLDTWHQRQFFKVELIQVLASRLSEPERGLASKQVLKDAQEVMQDLGLATHIQTTTEGFDLLSPQGIELGSYGYREVGDLAWVYGTGIAEPRFSLCLKDPVFLGSTSVWKIRSLGGI